MNVALLFLASAFPGALHAQSLLLINANLVDVALREIVRAHLLLEDGLIVGRMSAIPDTFEGELLDLDGKWVMPGLVDLHIHAGADQAPGGLFEALDIEFTLRRHLYAGVTAVLDLFGDEDALFAARQQQRAAPGRGSDLFASLSCLTATNGHCTQFGSPTRTIDSPEEARRQIQELAIKAPDVLKIVYSVHPSMPTIDRDTLNAAITAGKDLGIKTVVHIDSLEDMRAVIDAGPDAITHLPDLDPLPIELASQLAHRGIAVIATLAVHTDVVDFVQEEALLDSPLATSLASHAIRSAYQQEYSAERVARMRDFNAMYYDSAGHLNQAGVKVLTGTDAGNLGTIHGYSMHREMFKLVQSGFTTWEALAAATIDPAAFLKLQYGLREGDAASLLILDGSPIDDITNTQKINRVIHHGKIVNRGSLLD